jgi:mannose-6-phosphate isomerase
MTVSPLPVVFEPIYRPKPWGGRRLATLLGKRLPGDGPIGESWELSDLPGNESRVHDGPLAGTTLHELVATWGRGLLGDALLVAGRFPLLVKFLDARENLSVQVHPKLGTGTYLPKPGTGALPRQLGARKMGTGTAPQRLGASPHFPPVKHEAWYVLHADPGTKLYIGLRPGVGPDDVARAADTPAIVDLLQTWNATPGECYYLPSGTPHALGAGVVVAEVQTPSDVTYRLYDWGRVGLDGRPRELHIEQALANIRYDVTPEMIRSAEPPRAASDGSLRLVACDCFAIDGVELPTGATRELPHGRMAIWIILSGTGRLVAGNCECRFGAGDVVLVPGGCAHVLSELASPCTYLAAGIPSR